MNEPVVDITNESYDDVTLRKVYETLCTEVSSQTAVDLINNMQNKGILFRERTSD